MLPRDPAMLLSFVNTKLRDQYPCLEDMCRDLSVDKEKIVSALAAIDYEYDPKLNKFV